MLIQGDILLEFTPKVSMHMHGLLGNHKTGEPSCSGLQQPFKGAGSFLLCIPILGFLYGVKVLCTVITQSRTIKANHQTFPSIFCRDIQCRSVAFRLIIVPILLGIIGGSGLILPLLIIIVMAVLAYKLFQLASRSRSTLQGTPKQ